MDEVADAFDREGREAQALNALIDGDETLAETLVLEMEPLTRHNLVRVCLLLAGLARNANVGRTDAD